MTQDAVIERFYGKDGMAELHAVTLLADILYLQGAKVGPGDIANALTLTGLHLTSPDGWDKTGTFHGLADERECPKCGEPLWKLRDQDSEQGWWHEREGFGFQRKCPE